MAEEPGLRRQMRLGTGIRIGLLATLAVAIAPSGASAGQPGVTVSVWTVYPRAASAAASVNVLTINDQRGIDNRISAFIGPTGRLVLTAPEGLGDPDGDGTNCDLDNAKPGEASAQQVSCAPGYIGAMVGDLGAGNDIFDADPQLAVHLGAVIDGQRRPMQGGPGNDRLVGGAAPDLLVGGPGADILKGGPGNDVLLGQGGSDRLNGGSGRDACKGGSGIDRAKNCEIARGIP
jgi:hypothetical protein